MNLRSNSRLSRESTRFLKEVFLFLMLFIAALEVQGAANVDMFSIVPAGDATYSELEQLAKAGFLSSNDLAASLTRYDVTLLIRKAERHKDEIVVAQADMEIPPPPDGTQSTTSETTLSPSAPASQSVAQAESDRAQAVQNLNSLEEAYQYELKLLKDKIQALKDKTDDMESQQYDLRKRLKGIDQFPTIAVHGLGRAYELGTQHGGGSGLTFGYDGLRYVFGFLDIQPEGTVSKEVKWNTIIRIGSNFLPATNNWELVLRRVTMDFNPPWFSAKVGDFDEAYTPLMMWNRDTLDLAYKPEMWARFDDYDKYESFLNNEPYWPLRGLKAGSDVIWPDSKVLRELSGSVFAHMIRNGFNDNGGWYIGNNIFTDWVFGANVGLKSQKWYLAGMSIQSSIDTYGLIYDEPIDTEAPGSNYNPYNSSTWAHQYILGSVRPDIKVGLGDDMYVGGVFEYANSKYQDDKQAPDRVFSDFALLGGPYFQFGNSKISLNYLNVGPYFYSPLAQTRQDNVDLSQLPTYSAYTYPGLLRNAIRNQYFLLNLPIAGGIFGFYDRTQDNTFPYGLATPNRQGFGGELDVKTLEKDALKIKGSAYFVQEISGNLVVNPSGTGFVPVDSPANSTLVPIRNFTYINLGPSFNLGPYIGFERDVEIGTNVRYEQTNSVLGTLSNTWLLGGIRVGVLPSWDISTSYSYQAIKGVEEGYNGTLFARYPYLYGNADLGLYNLFNLNGNIQNFTFSNNFKINRNSTLDLDYEWSSGTIWPNRVTTLNSPLTNQFAEVTYEVQF